MLFIQPRGSLGKQFSQSQYVIGNASFDGWRNPNGLVNAATVVICEVQGPSKLEVVEFL